MSKATIQDILDEGFRPAQFGMADNATVGWSDAGGFVDRVLQGAGRWAADRIGAAEYAAAVSPSYVHDRLVRAEVCYSKAILFGRRVGFLDASGTVSVAARDMQYTDRREMLAHAAAAFECAQIALSDAIRAVGGDPSVLIDGVGASFGHVETGPFPPQAATATA